MLSVIGQYLWCFVLFGALETEKKKKKVCEREGERDRTHRHRQRETDRWSSGQRDQTGAT